MAACHSRRAAHSPASRRMRPTCALETPETPMAAPLVVRCSIFRGRLIWKGSSERGRRAPGVRQGWRLSLPGAMVLMSADPAPAKE